MKDSLVTTPPGSYLVSGSRFTACAAALCGLHCALTPVLVVTAPALALSEGVERVVWAGTVLGGAILLVLGPARRNAAVSFTFVGGAALWAASLAGWLAPLPETAMSAAGSLILAAAMVLSARVCHAASCSVCAEEERPFFRPGVRRRPPSL